MKPQAVKGTFDILPQAEQSWKSQEAWRHLYRIVNEVFTRSGVKEITPPIFEHADVFVRSVGASADIVVQKEMYTFEDAGGRLLALRPEFTGSVLRAYIEHGMHTLPSPVKLWSRGPVFRAERQPQRGRFRQFHQVNCEFLGLDTPLIDAEAIALLYTVLKECGLKNLVVKLGSVGDPGDLVRYNAYLREALEPVKGRLSETSRTRLELNPLRVLDSKDEGDQALVRDLRRPLDLISDEARAHFDQVCTHLTAWHVPFDVDNSIVRGLDYYRRTAFEIHHPSIGAQSALCGGGRYDGLVESLGGPKTPGIGWAFGVERVLDAMVVDEVGLPAGPPPVLFLVPMDDGAVSEVAMLAFALRRSLHVEYAYAKRNPAKGLKEADRSGATYAALRGPKEREEGGYQLKHLASGEQFFVREADLMAFLADGGSRMPNAQTAV
jgi:histidyl-tRNA synthetase